MVIQAGLTLRYGTALKTYLPFSTPLPRLPTSAFRGTGYTL